MSLGIGEAWANKQKDKYATWDEYYDEVQKLVNTDLEVFVKLGKLSAKYHMTPDREMDAILHALNNLKKSE